MLSGPHMLTDMPIQKHTTRSGGRNSPYLHDSSSRIAYALGMNQRAQAEYIKDPYSRLLQGSSLCGALLCEHVYDCNGCERSDNAPESLTHTLKNLTLWPYR